MIDLRSDSASTPTPEMVHAMSIAATDPPGFHAREDRYVRRFEAELAEMIGTEDALFCPTCTMANQISVGINCKPGDAVIVGDDSHLVAAEGTSAAALFGASFRLARPGSGKQAVGDLLSLIDVADAQQVRSSLVWLENTHVRSGGTVVSLREMDRIHDAAKQRGIPLHLDGSRLFNAATALGATPASLCERAESVSISMNKGLAGPTGAALAGSREFIREAERIRQRLGGAWRSANMAAAAASVALRTMIERLPADHAIARELASELSQMEGLVIDIEQVQSNIVLVGIDPAIASPSEAIVHLEKSGVRASSSGRKLRLVTYYQIRHTEMLRVIAAFRHFLSNYTHKSTS